jgi:lipoyl synthase
MPTERKEYISSGDSPDLSSPRTSHHPDWIRIRMPGGSTYVRVKENLRRLHVSTVCEQAHCPNLSECWNRGTATFLILGEVCTRNCRFCAVSKGEPAPPDSLEPVRVAQAVEKLGLHHVVITSVNRDDLPDGGAAHFSAVMEAIRKSNPQCRIEVLIPDFQGSTAALLTVIDARPSILNHNIETVFRLYPAVRPQADYHQSLDLLRKAKSYSPALRTKSGLMIGLGETEEEIRGVMIDLLHHGAEHLTLGQYLQPTRRHLPVVRYWTPEEFSALGEMAYRLGFQHVESAPLARSSYHAENGLQ